MIKLSIIVPFYNVELYIEQCIRSLYNQDLPQSEFEVICVDDCSPDNSRSIVERLQLEFNTLHLICNKTNLKLGGARNAGLRAAHGKYVWFVDSDDYVLPNCLGKILREFESADLDFVHFNNLIYENCTLVKDCGYAPFDSEILSGIDLFLSEKMPWQISHVVAWNKIYSRSFLLKNELCFMENAMYEDNDFCFRLHYHAQKVKHINVDAYVYRINDQSITHSKGNATIKCFYQIKVLWKLIGVYNKIKSNCNRDYLLVLYNFISWIIERICQYFCDNEGEQLQLLKKEFRLRMKFIFPFCSKKQFIRLFFQVYSL
jgi:glycosyltransferase involved in cell wall biosynthesis